MRSETRLDFAVFQLTPTRTRCELLVSAGGVTEKVASGLLKPFLAHLKAAEEEIERGGYSIKLVPYFADSANVHGAVWFTKGTIERFVRFVSTPEVLERVSSVEAELVQIEEAITIQANEARVDEQCMRSSSPTPTQGGFTMQAFNNKNGSCPSRTRRNSMDSREIAGRDSSKWRLLRAMDARRLMLQKEQVMAFARAAAAGFDMEHMEDLVAFAGCFGATRLRDACVKFMALCKKKDAGLWMEEMDLAATEAGVYRPERSEYVQSSTNFSRGKEYDTSFDVNSEAGDEPRDDMSMRSLNSFYRDGRGFPNEEDIKGRRGHQEDGSSEIGGDYGPAGGYRPMVRSGMVAPSTDELHASAYGHDMLGRPYSLSPHGYPGNRVTGDPVVYQGEHGYEYRDVHTQGARAGIANQSSRYMQGYYGISASTSPPSRLPGWIPPEEQIYDCRGHYGSAEQSGRDNMHVAVSHGHHGHYGRDDPGLHSGYADGGNRLQRRQGENHMNWVSQQPPPPPEYWQGNASYGSESRAQHYAGPIGVSVSPYISNSPAHQRETCSPDLRGLSNTQDFQSALRNHPSVKAESLAREVIGEVQVEVQQPAADALASLTTAASAQQCNEEKGVTSAGNTDQSSPSAGGKQALSPKDSANRRLARRSTSPKLRSSSPLRKVQVGRSGTTRRSGLVVIRNINYITSSSHDTGAVTKDRGSDSESDDSDSESNEDILMQKTGQVRFSVKDAINLFEKKRKESSDAVKKSSRRGSTGSRNSSFNERVKQWSEASARRTKEGRPDEDSDVHSKQGSCTVDQEVRGDDSITSHSKSEEDEVESHPTHPVEQDKRQVDASFGLMREQFDAEASPHHQSSEVKRDDLPGKDMMLEKRKEEGSRKSFALLPIDQVGEQSTDVIETTADDFFMLPSRGQQKEKGSWGDDPESKLVAAQIKDTVQDDSYIVLARVRDQSSSWRTALNMEIEISADQENRGVEKEAEDASSFEEDLMYIPERHTGRDSLGKMWNTRVDHDMEFNKEGEKDEDEETVVGGNESPTDQQGRFYEQYREKRDAKLREQPGPKRAEREAKLKAMQDALEKQKAEMASRTGGRTSEGTKYAVTADAQLRAEKLRHFKAGLLESKRKKDEEEQKRINEIRMQRRERIAARSSPTAVISGSHSASSTPRVTRQTPATPKANPRLSPSKNSKIGTVGAACRTTVLSLPKAILAKTDISGVTARPRRAQYASVQAAPACENFHSRSVPSLRDLPNAKPTMRNSLGDKVRGSARIQAKLTSNMHQSKSANDASPLKSDGGLSFHNSVARATVFSDDKKRHPVSSRRSNVTIVELKTFTNPPSAETVSVPLKGAKQMTSEPAVSRGAKRTLATTAVPQDAKPFLRKGTGIGPGSGAVIRKLKSSQVSDIPKSMGELGPNAPFGAITGGVVADRDAIENEAVVKIADSAVAVALIAASNSTDVKVQETRPAAEPQDVINRAGYGPRSTAIRVTPSLAQEVGNKIAEGADVSTSTPKTVKNEPLLIDQTGVEPSPMPGRAMEEAMAENKLNAVQILDTPMLPSVAAVVDKGPTCDDLLAPLYPAESSLASFPQVSTPEDYNRPRTLASPSPSLVTMVPNIENYGFVLASPSDTVVPDVYEAPVGVSTTPLTAGSSSRTFSKLQRSLSPDPNKVDMSKSRKKKGSTQKSSLAHQGSKDAPRGFKRLLNFGRRISKGNTADSSEWVSASTASEGEDDAEDTKVGISRLSDIPNTNVESGSKNARLRPTSNDNGSDNLKYLGESPESGRTDSNGSGGSVPRSFFSLPSFRSKHDSRYRA